MSSSRLRLLLIEDKADERDRFLNFCAMTEDMEIVGTAAGCREGIPLVATLHPDVLILDLQLADGTGMDFLSEMEKLPLVQRPFVVVTTVVVSNVILAMVREYGSNFEFIKTNPDYSPELVIKTLRNMRKYLHGVPYMGPYVCCNSGHTETLADEKARAARLRELIRYDINRLGITPNLKGSKPIEEALLMLAMDREGKITKIKMVIEHLACVFDIPIDNLTRNIRSAIESAWTVSTPDEKLRIYPGAVNAKRGNPTIKEFLFTMAEKYKTGEDVRIQAGADNNRNSMSG